jgi:hypothetical protein
MLGAFALVAAGAVSQVHGAGLLMDVLALIGIVTCLAGWRVLVVARHRERSSPSGLQLPSGEGHERPRHGGDSVERLLVPTLAGRKVIHPAASQESARSAAAADRADHCS